MKAKRWMALLLSVVMLIGMVPISTVLAYEEEEEECVEIPIPVTAEGKTYSLFTEQYLDDLHGMSFLYVIKRDGRFYTPAHPGEVGEYKAFDSVPAVDITAYWDEETNTFSGIPDSAGVGVMQYQTYPFPSYGGQALYLDGGIMFSLSVPFEDDGSTWFGSLDYYDRDETYSYSRALWNATGGGSGYFYEAYYDWYNDGGNVYGVLALKGDRFAMRNYSEEFEKLGDDEEPMFDVGGYLYAAPCNHVAPEHSDYVAPTCMDKGCKEYWYCVYCDGYFADKACTDAYGHMPILPALDHIYGDTACNHCGRAIPVYTRITSYDQFASVDPNASFIAVAEIDDGNGGLEYYVLKQPLNIVSSDIDEDGVCDILLIDEDQSGVADVLEQDLDGDGIADAMRVDGFWSEETLDGVLDDMEIEQYLFELEMEYTGGYMPGTSLLDIIPVTPDAEGGIIVKNMGALEFVMERVIPDDKLDEQYYGDGATKLDYANDFIFRVPNFWIRPMVMVDNNFYQMPYEQGDSRVWGVLFGDDVKALGHAHFDETFPDDAVVMYTEPFYSLNTDGELAHALRFLVNGDEKHFWMTSYSYWEETVGTEIPIYLYCSDAGEGWHEHIYGPWSKQNDEIHVRYCTVDGCTEYDFGGHHIDYESERTPDTDNPELGHWVACTDCGENIHEYHTREEYNYRYDMWRDAGDGVHHYVNCEECGGVAAYEEHDWGEWSWSGIWNSETQEYVNIHLRSCECFPCPGDDWRVECIYDEGVVTTEPTCTEPGVITYTCIVSGCTMETRTYTEEIPAIGHAWGEWEHTDIANVEQRVCANDPTHVEQRELAPHEHEWSDWKANGNGGHNRYCNCGESETGECVWDEGKVTTEPTHTEPGIKTYTCTVCGDVRTEEIPTTPEHEWSDWKANGNGGHNRYCNCGESETGECVWDEGKVTTEPTHTEPGIKTYTCTVCGDVRTEEIPTTPEHEWSDWKANGNGGHNRYCNCGESETGECVWDEGKVTTEPTYDAEGERTYTCEVCGDVRTEPIDRLEKVDEIVLPENEDIKVCVPEGSGAILDADAELTVEHVEPEFSEPTTDSISDQFGDGAEILTTYEIGLLLDGMEYDPNGDVEVTLPVPDAAEGFASVEVVFIDEEGNVVPCVTNDNGDGTLTFVTNHFSTYAIVGVEPIVKFVYGDCNGDGEVNGKDNVRLLQYLANYSPATESSTVEVGEGADCNGDGKIDGKDSVRLLRYLANYDPATGESSVTLGK